MSKRRSALPKNARLQVVLTLLESFSKLGGLRSTDILKIVQEKGIDVSIKTILRDLNELSLYYPISDEKRDGQNYWLWIGEKRTLTFIDARWMECFLDYRDKQLQLKQEAA